MGNTGIDHGQVARQKTLRRPRARLAQYRFILSEPIRPRELAHGSDAAPDPEPHQPPHDARRAWSGGKRYLRTSVFRDITPHRQPSDGPRGPDNLFALKQAIGFAPKGDGRGGFTHDLRAAFRQRRTRLV